MTHAAASGHPGGSLSAVEIVAALYLRVLRHDPASPVWPDRDRFILSKAHAVPVLYAFLAECGYLPFEELLTFRRLGSRLQGHSKAWSVPGVEMSGGSLGQGLSYSIGQCLAARLDGRDYRVYCLLGDGELDEGQCWEAAMAAAHYGLANLTAVVDRNGIQNDGFVKDIMGTEPLADKWRAFGFETVECDGHDVAALRKVLANPLSGDRPGAVICHTVKGKGIPMAEHDAAWHHKNKLTPDEVAAITEALGAA